MQKTQLPEVLVFEIIEMIPCLILALLPFRMRLQSWWRIIALAAVLCSLVFFSRILALFDLKVAAFTTIIRVLLYIMVYKVGVRVELPKVLFVLLIILNYTSFVAIFYSYLSFYFFPDEFSINPYCYQSSLILIGVFVVTFPIAYWMMDKKIRPLMDTSENIKIWNFLWFVPATFCFSYYYNFFSNGGILSFSSNWRNMIFSTVMMAGSFFVTYIVVRLVEESNINLQLKTENYQLVMQTVQYENLKSRMEETRRARHDLRQNIAIIQSYLDTDNKKGLQDYIHQYRETFPCDSPIIYCENCALNAVIVYYSDLARSQNIHFTAEVQYPSTSGIADTDTVVLFGNLLENAVEACSRQENRDAFIHLLVKNEGDTFVIALDNSYDGTIHKVKDAFLSSKRNSLGIGTTSIQKIAEKYHGVSKFEYKNNIFYVSIMLVPKSS